MKERAFQLINTNLFKTEQSWRTEADRRAFFDKYAASKGMDPRNRYFWSSVTVREIKRCQPVCSPPRPSRISPCFFILVNQLLFVLLQFYSCFSAGVRSNSYIPWETIINMSHAAVSRHRPDAVALRHWFVLTFCSHFLSLSNNNNEHQHLNPNGT